MLSRLTVTTQPQTATKRIVLCCGCVGLSFLAIVGFGLLPRIQAAENILPDRQVHATPTKIQPKLAASYGKLPLSFEANQGQVRGPVKFLSHGRGYSIFLTDDEAVLSLKKSSVVSGQSSVAGNRLSSVVSGRLAGILKSWQQTTDNGPRTTDRVLRMKLVGTNPGAAVIGSDELPGKSNYFLGSDPKKWRTNVPSYGQVKYEGVYPGVDLVYYGNQRQLEYDFVVEPGANPNQIKLSFAGADGMRVDAASGDLVLKLGEEEVRFRKPDIYQPPVAGVYDRRRRSQSAATAELDGAFVVASHNEVAFRVAGYDLKRALVIDPVLSYSTYLGGSSYEGGSGIAIDSAGDAYVTGQTGSTDFPTVNPLQATYRGTNGNAFVAKLNAAGSALVYSTYLGGSLSDYGTGIAVDSSGNAYVTGTTTSPDFPTVNPFQATNHGAYGNVFVAKLNAAGSALVYSTYLGGGLGDFGLGIAVDPSGNAHVTGVTGSPDFPTANAIQATCGGGCSAVDAFVAELNADGSALVYSTFLGGTSADGGFGIAVDSSGNAYVTGYTESTDFPTANPLQATNHGVPNGQFDDFYNAFVAKVNAGGSTLVYSTYLGGSIDDRGHGIAVDSSGNAYVIGTACSSDFPTTANALQKSLAGSCTPLNGQQGDAFVAKLNAAGSALVYSTYLGGSRDDSGQGIAVDSSGNAHVTGQTLSTDFPTANPLQVTNEATPDEGNPTGFVAELNSTGSALVYSTYLGGNSYDSGAGIAVDSSGNTYVTGDTASTDFPTANPLQATNNALKDLTAFVAKISTGVAGPLLSFSPPGLVFPPQTLATTSAPQTGTVTNTGPANLTISTVTVSGENAGDFAKSADTCTGATVTPKSTCTVSATFTPSATGSRSASLTFTDNTSGSPQSFALSGTVQDFTLAAASGSPTSATVAPGSPASYTLSLGSVGGMSGTVNFTCAGAPSEATCTVSPNPATVGISPTNVTVSVTTTAASVSAPRSRPLPPGPPLSPGFRGLLMLALVLAAMAWAIGRRNQPCVSRWQFTMVPLALGLLLTLALAGCGGGSSTTSNSGTPPGNYTLTVTGAAGSGSSALSHSMTLTLTVS